MEPLIPVYRTRVNHIRSHDGSIWPEYGGYPKLGTKHLCRRRAQVYVHAAVSEALKSSMGFAHGCVVVRRGRIVGRGHNVYVHGHGARRSVHAEIAALNSIKSSKMLRDATVYVVRLSRDTTRLMCSKPCPACAHVLERTAGVRAVYYSV